MSPTFAAACHDLHARPRIPEFVAQLKDTADSESPQLGSERYGRRTNQYHTSNHELLPAPPPPARSLVRIEGAVRIDRSTGCLGSAESSRLRRRVKVSLVTLLYKCCMVATLHPCVLINLACVLFSFNHRHTKCTASALHSLPCEPCALFRQNPSNAIPSRRKISLFCRIFSFCTHRLCIHGFPIVT
jgi:hypothetical protein